MLGLTTAAQRDHGEPGVPAWSDPDGRAHRPPWAVPAGTPGPTGGQARGHPWVNRPQGQPQSRSCTTCSCVVVTSGHDDWWRIPPTRGGSPSAVIPCMAMPTDSGGYESRNANVRAGSGAARGSAASSVLSGRTTAHSRYVPQGFNSQPLSFFQAVPKLPRWYTDAPAGENVNASNFSSTIFFTSSGGATPPTNPIGWLHSHKNQTPPDLVVKLQPIDIDIIDVILGLVLRPRIVYQREIKG